MIGQRIRALRKCKKMSQEAFGKKVGVSHTHISEVETGKKNPSRSLVMLMEQIFSVSLSEDLGNAPLHIEEGHAAYSFTKNYPPEFQPFIDILIEILQSGDGIIISAVKENLKAFKEAVARGRQVGAVSKKGDGQAEEG